MHMYADLQSLFAEFQTLKYEVSLINQNILKQWYQRRVRESRSLFGIHQVRCTPVNFFDLFVGMQNKPVTSETVQNFEALQSFFSHFDVEALPPLQPEGLQDEQQEIFFGVMGSLSLRLITLFSKTLSLSEERVSYPILQDIRTNPSLPPSEQIHELGIWRALNKLNTRVTRRVNKFLMEVNRVELSGIGLLGTVFT
eukprot:TRINITY_DN5318_c0_g1_i2.p1 TRINITY_DN5318_c0_g1~~TRINITY_DN5318_c0_g1_i2.p1  ORF type:complete len:197 (+),score=18.76 TRINITY_DN5318_c0_g1_i2:3-593(+)